MPTDSIVPTPQPAPDPPPQAAMFTPAYAAEIYRRRHRAVLAVQAELAAAARAGRPREGHGDAPCK